MQQTDVSIIIVSYNVQYFLALCLDSVMAAIKPIRAEIIVVDNASSDDSCQLVKEQFPTVTLIANSTNAGFSKANNQALAVSSGKYIHYLNPDTVLPEDFYAKTIAYLNQHETVGCLGPRLIDGRGQFAFDSKKSFPSFWTSVSKVSGLSSLFPHSKTLNRYYAAHVPEHSTAEVDILSGCCLLVRRSAMEASGGPFDESYFMYCEDVDLCHRIRLNGYQNIYYPEVTVVHYKGESTRKLSYKYMKIFYEAHALFVKKYYPKRLGIVYNAALRSVLMLRNFITLLKHLFSVFKMFLLDAIVLSVVTLLVQNVWFDSIVDMNRPSVENASVTITLFVLIWMINLFFNGAYDKPFSLYKAGRGMLTGTVIALAGYGLLPIEYRYSRGVVLFSGMTGTMAILLARWLLAAVKWIKLVPRGKVDYKAAIIANETDYENTLQTLAQTGYNLEIAGRISTSATEEINTLGNIQNLNAIRQQYRINELVFNSHSISYKAIMENMEYCAPKAYYKIHVMGNAALVGSNNLRHHAEEFSLDKRFKINTAEGKRNKRFIDIVVSLSLLLAYPFAAFKVRNKSGLLNNIFKVLSGKCTWVGYQLMQHENYQTLPKSKPSVVPPYLILEAYTPNAASKWNLAAQYARNYSILDDLRAININFKWLGSKSF